MKFGIASSFNITYVAHKQYFPVLFATTSLGYTNFICRIFTGFTPILSQVSQTISTQLFAFSSVVGAIIVLFLREIREEDFKYGKAKVE